MKIGNSFLKFSRIKIGCEQLEPSESTPTLISKGDTGNNVITSCPFEEVEHSPVIIFQVPVTVVTIPSRDQS